MNEVKSPKKPLIYYYMIVVLLVLLFNSMKSNAEIGLNPLGIPQTLWQKALPSMIQLVQKLPGR